MTGLRLGVVISLVLLGGVAYAEGSKNVSRPVDDTQQFEQGKKIAIVVGVESYNERLSGFRALDYAKDDAERVASILKNLGYQVDLLVDGEASRDIILNRIRQKAKLSGINNGTLVFYFSGHGFTAGEDNYLATSGAVADMLQDSGLGLSKVVESIRGTGVRRAVLLVDACRNNPRPGAKGGVSGYADIDPGEGVQILYSTGFGDVSWENDAFKHGVFSHFLAEGLSGQGAQNGLVTFNSLASYVEQQVSGWTDSNMSQTQQPFRRSDGDFHGDFVLARLGDGGSVPPPAPAVAPEPVLPVAPVQKSFEPTMIDVIPVGKTGTFTMGCDENRDNVEGGCQEDEKPAHQVTLAAFKMAETETTVGQYMACVDAGGCPAPEWLEKGSEYNIKTGTNDLYKKFGSALADPNYPIVGVSWDNTKAYAEWLSKETSQPYRLPTEAEWEYAARGGSDTAYPWGNSIGKGNANCGSDCGDKFEYTAPVGSFAANGYGLKDMHGNVWEWVLDNWHDNYNGAPVDGSAWKSGDDRASRVLRGGSWFDLAQGVRSARRNRSTPVIRFYGSGLGFRLASGQQ